MGYGSDGLGSSASYGYFFGPGHYAIDTRRHSGAPLGAGLGVGGGGFWTNADRWCDLGGPFDTTIIGLGPIGSVEVDAGDNNIYVIQLYPGPLGKGNSYGIVHLETTTPAAGSFEESVEDLKLQLRQGVGQICGCRL